MVNNVMNSSISVNSKPGGKSVDYYINTETNQIVEGQQPARDGVMQKIEKGKKYYEKGGKIFITQIDGASEVDDLYEKSADYYQKSINSQINEVSKKNEAEREVEVSGNRDVVEQLKLMLGGDNLGSESMKNQKIIESLQIQNNQLQTLLMELLKLKKSGLDSSDIQNQIKTTKNSVNENSVRYFYAPRYDNSGIETLKYSPISLVNYANDKDEVSLLTLRKPSAILRRFRITKLVRNLQNIGPDSEKGVNYVMSMARVRRGGKISVFVKKNRRKVLSGVGVKRDMDTFKAEYNDQVSKFMDRIESLGLTDNEKNILDQVKKRLDYYRDKYIADKIQKMVS